LLPESRSCVAGNLLQVKGAVCTGLKSGDVQVWNFSLAFEDEAKWEEVGGVGDLDRLLSGCQYCA